MNTIAHLQADLENLRKRNNTANIQFLWDEEIRIMLELKALGCKTVFYGLDIDEQIARRQKLKTLLLKFMKPDSSFGENSKIK